MTRVCVCALVFWRAQQRTDFEQKQESETKSDTSGLIIAINIKKKKKDWTGLTVIIDRMCCSKYYPTKHGTKEKIKYSIVKSGLYKYNTKKIIMLQLC